MARASRAIVQTAPRTLELRELPLPEIGPDDALLQIEACGICGSDYEQYPTSVRAEPVEAPVRFPVTIGTPVEPLSREVPRGVARERGRPPRRAGVRAGPLAPSSKQHPAPSSSARSPSQRSAWTMPYARTRRAQASCRNWNSMQ